jgi:diacylglycerol kinase (ATP)
MSRRVLLILNPTARAGRAGRLASDARSLLAAAGCAVEWRETTGPGHATAMAAAAAGGFDVIAAAGGDGTAREVCSGVLGSSRPEQPVVLLPLGTGNDLAHVAGTGSLTDAARAAAVGAPRRFDAIEVACATESGPALTHAFCFAAVGLAADVVRLTTPRLKRLLGPRLCYSAGFFRALAGYRPVAARVTADGTPREDDYLLICAGNTARAGGRMMHLSPGASPHDGSLDLSLIRATGRLEVALQFIRLLRGTHVRHPRAAYFPAREIVVSTRSHAEVQLDGDTVGATPARFTVRPEALRLIAPP